MGYYDRYSRFRGDGKIGIVPFGEIRKHDTDYFENYDRTKNRLDIISYRYYNDSDFGWLILQANPELGSIEYDIPNGALLRIPYPLETALIDYNESISEQMNKGY